MKKWITTLNEYLRKWDGIGISENYKKAYVISKDKQVIPINNAECIFVEISDEEGMVIHLDINQNDKYLAIRSWPSSPEYSKCSRVVTRCSSANLLEVGIETYKK